MHTWCMAKCIGMWCGCMYELNTCETLARKAHECKSMHDIATKAHWQRQCNDNSWFAENPFSSKLWMITCLLTWFFRTWTLCSNQSNVYFLMQMCKWRLCDCWHCAGLWCVCPWQGRDNTIHELSNVCRGSVYLKMLANYIWLIASMWSIAITHILQTKTVMN